jgi:hypothetical protein
MDSIKKMLRAMPWWGWPLLMIAIIIGWQYLTGWGTSRKLYNWALKQYEKEESDLVKNRDAWIKTCEDEIKNLSKERDRALLDRDAWRRKSIETSKEVIQLKEINDALEKKLMGIVIPDDPDRIIFNLNQRGLSSIHKRRSRSN